MHAQKTYCVQGRSREFAKGGDKRGPLAGSRGRAPVVVWGRSPQKSETHTEFPATMGACTHVPLGNATDCVNCCKYNIIIIHKYIIIDASSNATYFFVATIGYSEQKIACVCIV